MKEENLKARLRTEAASLGEVTCMAEVTSLAATKAPSLGDNTLCASGSNC